MLTELISGMFLSVFKFPSIFVLFIFKIPALKIVDPSLIHVEVVHDNFGTCGKILFD